MLTTLVLIKIQNLLKDTDENEIFRIEFLNLLNDFYLIALPLNQDGRRKTIAFFIPKIEKLLLSNGISTQEFKKIKQSVQSFLEENLSDKDTIEAFNAYIIHKNQINASLSNVIEIATENTSLNKMIQSIELDLENLLKIEAHIKKINKKVSSTTNWMKAESYGKSLVLYLVLFSGFKNLFDELISSIKNERYQEFARNNMNYISVNLMFLTASMILTFVVQEMIPGLDTREDSFLKRLYKKPATDLISSVFNLKRMENLLDEKNKGKIALSQFKKEEKEKELKLLRKQSNGPREMANITPVPDRNGEKEKNNNQVKEQHGKQEENEDEKNKETSNTGITYRNYSSFFSNKKDSLADLKKPDDITWYDDNGEEIILPPGTVVTKLERHNVKEENEVLYIACNLDQIKDKTIREIYANIASEGICLSGQAAIGKNCIEYLGKPYLYQIKRAKEDMRVDGTKIGANGKNILIFLYDCNNHPVVLAKCQDKPNFSMELKTGALALCRKAIMQPS